MLKLIGFYVAELDGTIKEFDWSKNIHFSCQRFYRFNGSKKTSFANVCLKKLIISKIIHKESLLLPALELSDVDFCESSDMSTLMLTDDSSLTESSSKGRFNTFANSARFISGFSFRNIFNASWSFKFCWRFKWISGKFIKNWGKLLVILQGD